jgi:quercetin dioxygenase-like cupin family protein
MDINIYHFDSLEDISKEAGMADKYKAVKIKSSFGPEIARITIEPFGRVSKHKADVDVIFYVIKGSIEIFIDDEKFIVHENDCIEVPKNMDRAVENKHDIKAEFLIFRLT